MRMNARNLQNSNMALISCTQDIFVLSLFIMITAQYTNAARVRKNNIFSDNATKMSRFNTKGQDLSLSTTSRTLSLLPSISHIKTSKTRSRHSMTSTSRKVRTRKTNYHPNSYSLTSLSAIATSSTHTENTTPSLVSIHTSSSSGWPSLKDVITHKSNKSPREVYKPRSLIENNKKVNTKSRKRLKRRRRILERKGHNRARRLIKQKLKIKSRMKNNSIVHQKSQKKRGKNLQSNLFNSHVGSTKPNQTSGSTIAPKTNRHIVVPSSSSSRYKRRKVEKVKTKTIGFKNQETIKSQNITSPNSYQKTVIDQALSQSNDSMLADEAPHILSGLEPEVSMMDYAWNEDKIEIDFKTVDDLRRLIEKAGGKFEGHLYSESVTMVASMESPDEIAISITSSSPEERNNVNGKKNNKKTMSTNTASSSLITSFTHNGMISSSPVPILLSTSLPDSETTVLRSSTPDPPITLSLGSWQIKEEDLPLYAGLASGILLLIIVIMSVTTWRICHAQRRSTKNRTKRDRRSDSSSSSSRHSSSDGSNRFNTADVSHTNAVSNKGLIMMSEAYELQVDNNGISMSMNGNQSTEKVSPSPGKTEMSSSSHVNEPTNKTAQINITSPSKGHDSMVCLTKGKGPGNSSQRVESSIINGTNTTNKNRNLVPQNNTFTGSSHADRAKELVYGDVPGKSGMKNNVSASSAVMDESDSFCCDANSQLLGGAMVASLLTGGTSPSPIRPPISGLPNATTTFEVECSDRITSSGASSGGGTTAGTASSGESRSGNSTTNGVAGSLELDIEQFTDYNDSRCFAGTAVAYPEVHPTTVSQNIIGDGNKTYVRVTPVDSFSPFTDYPLNHQMISTQSAIQSGFHTFHPRGGSRAAIRTEGTVNCRGSGSSPDSMGAGDTLTGCVSTPSSEALDQVSDLRHSRTLPKRVGGIISNDNAATNGTKENYTFLNNNNYSNKTIPSANASVLNGNLGTSTRSSARIVEDLYAKVDYHTKAKNRSRVGESFSGASTTSNIINGLTSHSDFNGAINHIAVVPPMKSNVTTSNNQQRTMLQQPPPHNMSLPLTSTSSSPCQFNLDAEKGIGCNNLKTFGSVNYHNRDNIIMSSMVNSKIQTGTLGGGVAVNGNIMTASTVVTSLDEECTTIPVSQLMLESYDRDTYKDFVKEKASEIHLTSSEVRAGSKIESSLLYNYPMQSLEEKGSDKVMGFSSDAIDISRPSTTTANSVEDCNDAGSSFSSGDTGGGGPTRTNL